MNRPLHYLAAGLLSAAIVLATAPVALGHGSMLTPVSRTYQCRYLDSPENPQTPACRAAVQLGGTQPVYDWNEVNLANANGQHRSIIPDGKLCSAGREKYQGFDLPRADWQANSLTSGAQTTFTFRATAPHRGTFELYVTRNGYDATQPLAWSTLEAAPFLRVVDPSLVDGSYQLSVQLPSGKSGRHLVYAIWQRSDSPEAFYSCSDVVFGGGVPSSALATRGWAPMVELVAAVQGLGTPSYVPDSSSHRHH